MTKHPNTRAQRFAARKVKLSNEEKKLRAQERAGKLRRKLYFEATKERETEDELRAAYGVPVS